MPDMPTDEVPRESTSTGEMPRPAPMRLMRAMEPELDQPDLTDPDTAHDLPGLGRHLADLKVHTLPDESDLEDDDEAGFEIVPRRLPASTESEDRVMTGTLFGIALLLATLSVLWAAFGG